MFCLIVKFSILSFAAIASTPFIIKKVKKDNIINTYEIRRTKLKKKLNVICFKKIYNLNLKKGFFKCILLYLIFKIN